MGAAAAAIAAVHARRIREILDAYRTAPATTPDSGRTPAELGLDDHERELRELLGAGVLHDGVVPGSYYLNERGYITYRDSGTRRRKIGVAMVLIIILVGVLVGALLRPAY